MSDEVTDLTKDQLDLLIKIYISQRIRDEGVLQSNIKNENNLKDIQFLLDQKYIKENKWYKNKLFETTRKGDEITSDYLNEYIPKNLEGIIDELSSLPSKGIAFLVNHHFQTVMQINPDQYRVKWNFQIVKNKRILEYIERVFRLFSEYNLTFYVNYYVSTRNDEIRGKKYVVSSHLIEYLKKKYFPPFSEDIIEYLNIYDLMQDLYYIRRDDIDSINLQWYNSIQHGNYNKKKIQELFKITAEKQITSDYRIGSPKVKFIEIYNEIKFKGFLEENIIDPIYPYLFDDQEFIISFKSNNDLSISSIPDRYETIGENETKELFIHSRNLEIKLRDLIKIKLGNSWQKQIRGRCKNVYDDLIDKLEKDKSWGIEPESDLLLYSDFNHYYQIIEKNSGLFASKNSVKLHEILAHIRIWVNNGRNPIMHSRHLTVQKYYTTLSAIEYLNRWIEYQFKQEDKQDR